VSWFKKSFGMTVVLAGTAVFGCSGSNRLVGNDGLTAIGGNNGGGTSNGGGLTPGGAAPALESTYELQQLNVAPPLGDDRPYLCLPEELPVDATGNAACVVLNARQSDDCNCAAAGLSPASAELTRAARLQTKVAGWCDPSNGGVLGTCSEVCVCQVDAAVGASLQKCETEAEPDASTTGWCYVSAAAGDAQSALVEACASTQKQRLRFFGPVSSEVKKAPRALDPQTGLLFLGCPSPRPVAAVGDPCISNDEYRTGFAGYSVKEVNIDDHASMCESHVCIQNHFQGRASCPYGQVEGGGDCLAAGSYDSVTVPVAPQLQARPARQASICSCQCAGPGPGPYCTCSESMQCEHLVDNLGVGDNHLAGSYCIPKDTQYDPQGDASTCSPGRCGAPHVYN